jgi:hypothetical protein
MSFDPADYGIPTQEWGPNVMTCGYVEAKERRVMAVGVDPASLVDYCGICVMESVELPAFDEAGSPILDNLRQRLTAPRYEIRNLRRLPHGLSWPQIVSEVARLMSHPEIAPSAHLVLDAGGLGGVFYDLCVSAGLRNIVGVKSTGSEGKERYIPGGYSVGKTQLVNNLRTVLETGKLLIPRDLPESKTFLEELRSFSLRISASGHPSFNSASGAHDDLISAACLCCFALMPRKDGAWQVESLSL